MLVKSYTTNIEIRADNITPVGVKVDTRHTKYVITQQHITQQRRRVESRVVWHDEKLQVENLPQTYDL